MKTEYAMKFPFTQETLDFMGISESEAQDLFYFDRNELKFGVSGEKHFRRDDPRLVAVFEKLKSKTFMPCEYEYEIISFAIVEIPMDMEWEIRYEVESFNEDGDWYCIAREYVCEPHREFKPDDEDLYCMQLSEGLRESYGIEDDFE